jgi:hypothetical protein
MKKWKSSFRPNKIDLWKIQIIKTAFNYWVIPYVPDFVLLVKYITNTLNVLGAFNYVRLFDKLE